MLRRLIYCKTYHWLEHSLVNLYLILQILTSFSKQWIWTRLSFFNCSWKLWDLQKNGVYIHVLDLEIYRIIASSKPYSQEKYDCGLGALLVAILHVITSNLAKSCLQSSSRWTVPKTTTVLINLLYCLGIHLLSIEYWIDDVQRMLTMWCI